MKNSLGLKSQVAAFKLGACPDFEAIYPNKIVEILQRVVHFINMTPILDGLWTKRYDKPGDKGWFVIQPLEESAIMANTFEDLGIMRIVIETCGEPFKVEELVKFLEKEFHGSVLENKDFIY